MLGYNRAKGSSTEKDREDREQVNTPKQCPVRLRTKAHREEKRGRGVGRAGLGMAAVGSPGPRGAQRGLRENGPEV